MESRNQSAGPRLCPNCRAIVGAGEPVCPQCGAEMNQRERARSGIPQSGSGFIRSMMARPTPFTTAFIVVCIVVYVGMTLTGGVDGAELVAFGAGLNSRIQAGEWWRFVTPIFLHVPFGALPLHLLMNMWALWNLGPFVEKFYGSAKFVVIWIFTGVAGCVASYFTLRPGMKIGTIASFLFRNTDVPSAGASGALFGLIGVLIVFGIKYRNELPDGFKRAFGTGLLPVVFINFGIGFWGRGFIDNSAHVGGLLAGLGLALVLDYDRPGQPSLLRNVWHVLQGLCLVLIAVCFFQVWRHYSAPPKQPAVEAFMVSINKGEHSIETCVGDEHSVTPDELAKLGDAEQSLSAVPRISPSADALSKDLLPLVQRCRKIASIPAGTPPTADRNALRTDYDVWYKRANEWVKTDGVIYGLRLDKSDKPGEPADDDAP